MLLEHGADVEAERGNGVTTLQFVISRGQDEIVKLVQRIPQRWTVGHSHVGAWGTGAEKYHP